MEEGSSIGNAPKGHIGCFSLLGNDKFKSNFFKSLINSFP